jgi:hypothetical protein
MRILSTENATLNVILISLAICIGVGGIGFMLCIAIKDAKAKRKALRASERESRKCVRCGMVPMPCPLDAKRLLNPGDTADAIVATRLKATNYRDDPYKIG